jgi:hypothetical protein
MARVASKGAGLRGNEPRYTCQQTGGNQPQSLHRGTQYTATPKRLASFAPGAKRIDDKIQPRSDFRRIREVRNRNKLNLSR